MRLPQRISLSREGWCYLVVMAFMLAGALLRQINLLMILFGMLAGALLVSWRLVKATLRKLEVQRSLPDSVSAGDLLIVEIAVSNRRRRLASFAVEFHDVVRRQGAPRGQQLDPRVLLTFLPAGQERSLTYRGRLHRRGRYEFGPLRMSTRFPLGLLRNAVNLGQKGELLVFPRLGRLTPRFNRWQESGDLGLGRTARQIGFLEGEFYALRDWRSGDSRRWVHWRTTARRQTAVVRQFEQQRNQDLAIVLDLWRPDSPSEQHDDAIELAVSFAATIVADLCRKGGRWLSLSIAACQPWSESGPTSVALLHEAMRGLAVAETADQDHLSETLAAAIDRLRPGTRLMVISTRELDLDARQFGELWAPQRRQAWRGRIRAFNTASDALNDFFVPA